MSYHVLSRLIMSYHVLSCLIMSYHVLSCLIMPFTCYHVITCVFCCVFGCPATTLWILWRSSHRSFVSWLSSHHTTVVSKVSCGCPATIFLPVLTKLTSGCPSQKNLPKNMGEAPVVEINLGVLPSKNFSRRPSVWDWDPQKNHPRKMGEAPAFETTLGVLPSKNFSRDPSVWDYLGGPSQKKIHQEKWVRHQFWDYFGGSSLQKFLKGSQCLRLSWWFLPKKNPPRKMGEAPVFETSTGVLASKNFSRDPSVWNYLGGPSQKKSTKQNGWGTSFWDLGVPPKKNPPRKMGEAPVFEATLGALPSKNFSRDPSVWDYLGGARFDLGFL